ARRLEDEVVEPDSRKVVTSVTSPFVTACFSTRPDYMFSMPRIRLDPTSRLPIEPQVPPVLDSLIDEPAPPIPEPTDYVELWARSSFSFLQAASLPEELVRVGAELGHGAIGICDRDGLYGIVRGWEECKRTGVRLVVGAEITLSDGPTVLLHV